MGEYLSINGERIKIGTCEELTDARLSQLQALKPHEVMRLEGNLPLAEYLNPAHGWFYRFPFPDEDDKGIGEFKDLDRGWIVKLSPELSPTLWAEMGEWEHYRIAHNCHIGFSYGFNVTFPCPLSNEFPKNDSVLKGDGYKIIEVVSQKQVDGEIQVVIRCGYCGALVRFDRDGAQEIAKCLWKTNNAQDSEMAHRIMMGYKTPTIA